MQIDRARNPDRAPRKYPVYGQCNCLGLDKEKQKASETIPSKSSWRDSKQCETGEQNPTEQNPADDVSRGLSVPDLSGRWLTGPEFLQQPIEEWPKEDSKPDATEVERECIKKKTVGMVTTEAVELKNVIEWKDYSSWKRLLRVSAWVLKFKNKLMAKIRRVREENSVAEESLTPNELEESRKVWIKEAQKRLKDRLKRNEFRTLSPFEDEEGIIRVGGRVENASSSSRYSYTSCERANSKYLIISGHFLSIYDWLVAQTTKVIGAFKLFNRKFTIILGSV